MPRKAKDKWVGAVPIAPRFSKPHELIIPDYAIRGFIRGMLKRIQKKEVPDKKAEEVLFCIVQSFTDERFATTDEPPERLAARAENKVTLAFHIINQAHPFPIVRVHADIVTQSIAEYPYNARNLTHCELWLDQHLPEILTILHKKKVCSDKCPSGSSLPTENERRRIAKSRITAELRNRILAYYHDTTETYVRQLLAGR